MKTLIQSIKILTILLTLVIVNSSQAKTKGCFVENYNGNAPDFPNLVDLPNLGIFTFEVWKGPSGKNKFVEFFLEDHNRERFLRTEGKIKTLDTCAAGYECYSSKSGHIKAQIPMAKKKGILFIYGEEIGMSCGVDIDKLFPVDEVKSKAPEGGFEGDPSCTSTIDGGKGNCSGSKMCNLMGQLVPC